MQTPSPIILASSSPRRRELLALAGIPFEVRPSSVSEDFPATMAAREVSAYLAEKKAQAVHREVSPGGIVLAADTVVVLGDRILGKPRNEQQAATMLSALSGQMHQVITGVCLWQDDHRETFTETTRVFFRELTGAQIRHYVSHWPPLDKAGAYGIQEWIGLVGIARIEGDYANVVGLPVSRVIAALEGFCWHLPL